MSKPTVLTFLVVSAIFAGPAGAHHSTPLSVDRRNPVSLQGAVTEFRLLSPHASLYIDVTDDHGRTVNWALDGGPVRGFILTGFTAETLPVGQEVTVIAYPSVTGAAEGELFSITLPDGRRYGGGRNLPP